MKRVVALSICCVILAAGLLLIPSSRVVAQAPTPVTVVNPLLPVQDVRRAGVGAQCGASFSNGAASCTIATIPANQVLVIEELTCVADPTTGSLAEPLTLNVPMTPISGGPPQSVFFRLPFTQTGTSSTLDWYGMATPLRIYAAAGTGSTAVQVSATFLYSNSGGLACQLSGHMA